MRFALSVGCAIGLSLAPYAATTAQAEQSCTYTLSPLSITVPGGGGSGQVNVTTGAGCAWTASTGTPWLSITTRTGVGSGVVPWTAVTNTLATQRIGILTIAGRDIFVIQYQPSGATSPPGSPRSLSSSVSGSSVTLSWAAPDSGGTPSTYIVAAGSTSGSTNIASFSTGNALTTLTVNNVANGRYFVRVSAQNSRGASVPSNEVTVTVPQECTTLGSPPSALQSSLSGRQATLVWGAPLDAVVTEYVIEVGSGPGMADLAMFHTGSNATTMTAPAAPGTYVVRVRAIGPCGATPPSDEIVVVVR